MSTADQLLENMLSWIEQNEACEQQLRKLAKELESISEVSKAGQTVGSTVAVFGAVCTVAGGVATLMSGGMAAPLLLLGTAYTATGGAISLSSEVLEIIFSSQPMKEAKKAAEKGVRIENKIQQLFKKLKMERKSQNPRANTDELDQHVVIEIVKAIARRKGLVVNLTFNFMYDNRHNKNFQTICVMTLGVLAVFAFKLGGTGLRSLYTRGAERIARLTSTTACKRAAKVATALGMVFTLKEAIENWTDVIKKNHVTPASKSLREKADELREVTRTLKGQLNEIEAMLRR
ncbi:uncharacterized protein LOC130185356 [Seriola aureovittata]|uniref:uncharacterized protein LOC130185356 n=1 Tax=Seriola aureovittata TaxID=2871759 RepID=UPI0024BDF4B8|nr:uncharacterized protein LOC130185356 [Seriola aureovittata]